MILVGGFIGPEIRSAARLQKYTSEMVILGILGGLLAEVFRLRFAIGAALRTTSSFAGLVNERKSPFVWKGSARAQDSISDATSSWIKPNCPNAARVSSMLYQVLRRKMSPSFQIANAARDLQLLGCPTLPGFTRVVFTTLFWKDQCV